MIGEINKDWYCIAGYYSKKIGAPVANICFDPDGDTCCQTCKNRYRKYPTPEQYKEKYDIDYPDDAAVYCYTFDGKMDSWVVASYQWAKTYHAERPVVCACTPWGCPPDDWRSE